jgi:hypothetical protein
VRYGKPCTLVGIGEGQSHKKQKSAAVETGAGYGCSYSKRT